MLTAHGLGRLKEVRRFRVMELLYFGDVPGT